MIQATIDKYGIHVTGHGKSEVCACVSMLMQELDDSTTHQKISGSLEGTSYVFKNIMYRSSKENCIFYFVEKCLLDLSITHPEEIVVNIANRE